MLSFLNGPPSLGQGSLVEYIAKTEVLQGQRNKPRAQPSATTAEMEMGFAANSDDGGNSAIDKVREFLTWGGRG